MCGFCITATARSEELPSAGHFIIFWSKIVYAVLRAGRKLLGKGGWSACDSRKLHFSKKKKLRSATKVVDDVRYDGVQYEK
jgi:hypothetical protein